MSYHATCDRPVGHDLTLNWQRNEPQRVGIFQSSGGLDSVLHSAHLSRYTMISPTLTCILVTYYYLISFRCKPLKSLHASQLQHWKPQFQRQGDYQSIHRYNQRRDDSVISVILHVVRGVHSLSGFLCQGKEYENTMTLFSGCLITLSCIKKRSCFSHLRHHAKQSQ